METQTAPEIKQDYFAIKRMSNSAMKYFKLSPLHYLHYLAEPPVKTQPMLFGTAFHAAILEPEKFDSDFISEPQVDKRTKEGKEIAAAFAITNQGKTIIPAKDYETLKLMRDRIFNHLPSMELLNEVKEVEKEILWTDKVTGIELKGKLDGIGKNFIIDLKTCQSAQPNQFAATAYNLDYHRQAALYVDGCLENLIPVNNFYFIAIEKEAPYGISVNRASEAFIEAGRKDYSSILENFRYWKELDEPVVGYEFNSPFNQFEINPPSWLK